MRGIVIFISLLMGIIGGRLIAYLNENDFEKDKAPNSPENIERISKVTAFSDVLKKKLEEYSNMNSYSLSEILSDPVLFYNSYILLSYAEQLPLSEIESFVEALCNKQRELDDGESPFHLEKTSALIIDVYAYWLKKDFNSAKDYALAKSNIYRSSTSVMPSPFTSILPYDNSQSKMMTQLLREWMKKDKVSCLFYIQIETEKGNEDYFQTFLKENAEKYPQECFELSGYSKNKKIDVSSLFSAWYKKDPNVVSIAQNILSDVKRKSALEGIISELQNTNPEDATALVSKEWMGEELKTKIYNVWSSFAQRSTDPYDVYYAIEQSSLSDEARELAYLGLMKNITASDLKTILDDSQVALDEDEKIKLVKYKFSANQYDLDQQYIKSKEDIEEDILLLDYLDGSDRNDAIKELAKWAESIDPSASISLYKEIPENERNTDYLTIILRNISKENPVLAAEAYVQLLPADFYEQFDKSPAYDSYGINYDSDLYEIVRQMMDHDPEEGKLWANSLSEGRMRDAVMLAIASVEMRNDPVGLMQYLSSVPDEEVAKDAYRRLLLRTGHEDDISVYADVLLNVSNKEWIDEKMVANLFLNAVDHYQNRAYEMIDALSEDSRLKTVLLNRLINRQIDNYEQTLDMLLEFPFDEQVKNTVLQCIERFRSDDPQKAENGCKN